MGQMRPELPQSHPVIAGYRVGDAMGKGPLGTIYRAVHESTGETVVIRGFTRPPNVDAGRWNHAKEQFRQLLTVHQRVADLPGAPVTLQKIVGFGEEQGIFWVASEYFEARPLHQILREEGAQSLQWAVTILRQVGEAIDWAAQHNLCHTDLTPANVLVVRDHANPLNEVRVEVINFGLAHARRKFGSPFAAPEQLSGVEGDVRADVYAVGALLHEILTGKPVFTGTADEIAQKTRTVMPEPLPQLPIFLQNILSKMLAKKPEQRYGRVLDAIADIAAKRNPASEGAMGSTGTSAFASLSQIAPHLGQTTRANDAAVRAELQLNRPPEIARGSAYVPLRPDTHVEMQDFDMSGQDIVELRRLGTR